MKRCELCAQCGKLTLLDRLLTRLHRDGHKVLIFSQVCSWGLSHVISHLTLVVKVRRLILRKAIITFHCIACCTTGLSDLSEKSAGFRHKCGPTCGGLCMMPVTVRTEIALA